MDPFVSYEENEVLWIASKYQTWTKVSNHTKVLSGKVSITSVEHFILQPLDVSLIGFNITGRKVSVTIDIIKPPKTCLSLPAVDFLLVLCFPMN